MDSSGRDICRPEGIAGLSPSQSGVRHASGPTLHPTESRRDEDQDIDPTDGEPGATDNPGDAQRLREDH